MSLHRVSLLAVFVGSLLVAHLSSAQPPAGGGQGRGQAPPPPQNLQVLPKDVPTQELLGTMRAFTTGLGVQCNYCHVDQPARDMASDAKQTKKTARSMMQMVAHVNEMIPTGTGKAAADVVKVQCVTCHRGKAIPENPAPAAAAAPAAPGAPPAGAPR